eukprot:1354507-Amorphochlora_amoeboformis.AAC.1
MAISPNFIYSQEIAGRIAVISGKFGYIGLRRTVSRSGQGVENTVGSGRVSIPDSPTFSPIASVLPLSWLNICETLSR